MMRIRKQSILLLFIALLGVAKAQEKTPKYYLADWESLKNYNVPEWYYDAKFGIWTHWGVYSVPAYRGTHAGEWYPRWMYLVKDEKKPFTDYENLGAATAQHHLETYGNPGEFGYHDFIPQFKAEKWDPDAWAQFGIDCGAKFFTITGMHHDGFALYDSKFTDWNAVKMGPKRDLVGDLANAVRDKGLKFGISNHFAHNRNYYQYYFNNGFDKIYKDRPELQSLYSRGVLDQAYIERWWNITTEMAQKYKPDLYYFDWGWNPSFWENERPEFAAFYYNLAIRSSMGTLGDPNVVINYKNTSMARGSGIYDIERGGEKKITKYVWQTDTSVSDHSWGYSTEDTFKSPKDLICKLTDIVSKNGILMLNFGPRADGSIPEEVSEPLLEMGKWLKSNGEAIYSTRPWLIAEEGPTNIGGHGQSTQFTAKDIRYTQSKDGKAIYATVFGFPQGKLKLQMTKVLEVTSEAKVTLLANGMEVPFSVNKQKQIILNLSKMKKAKSACDYAYSFKIEGIKMTNSGLNPIDLADEYIEVLTDYNPFSEKYESEFPYLSGVKPIFVKAHNGEKRDHNYWDKGKIVINGKEFDNGLMLCPTVEGNKGLFYIRMKEMPKVKGITAEIGIDDVVKSNGASAFIIDAKVNGKWVNLYESKVFTGDDDAIKIDVKIPAKAKYLRFVTTDGGNGCGADHAVWADAKFY